MKNLILTLTILTSIFNFACKTEAKGIQSYSYRENGTMAQPNCDFKVERVNNKLCHVIKYRFDTETHTETYDTIVYPIQLLKKIEAIVAKHKMDNYEKDYKSEYDVTDGISWGMRIKFTDGTKVSSYGDNAWPNDDGLKIIEELINKTQKTKKQKNKKTTKQ